MIGSSLVIVVSIVAIWSFLLGRFATLPAAAPNERLAAYDAWHRQLDVLLALRMKEPGQVVRWRIEAEQAMRANGKPGLSGAGVEDYGRRFLPAYATWAGTVNDGRWRGPRLLSFTLDGDRVPVAGEDRHV